MNLLLSFATLVGAFALLVSSQGAQDLKNDLPTLNEGRRNAAKEKGIANMWKLEWDDNLAGKTRSACGKDVVEGLGRVLHMSNDPEVNMKMVNGLGQSAAPGQLPIHFGVAEIGTHALQTRIGCDRFDCQYPFPDGRSFKFDAVCIMGPMTTYQLADIKPGPAGTACGGARVEDGLCVAGSAGRVGSGEIGLFSIMLLGFMCLL